jgi:hypothetical protein
MASPQPLELPEIDHGPCHDCDGTGCVEEYDPSVGYHWTGPCTSCDGTGKHQPIEPTPEELQELRILEEVHQARRAKGEPLIDDSCPF